MTMINSPVIRTKLVKGDNEPVSLIKNDNKSSAISKIAVIKIPFDKFPMINLYLAWLIIFNIAF